MSLPVKAERFVVQFAESRIIVYSLFSVVIIEAEGCLFSSILSLIVCLFIELGHTVISKL